MQTSSQFRKPISPLKPKHQKYITSRQCVPIGCTRQEVGSFTLIRHNITFTTTDIPSTINTHNTELRMVKVHINNTKHITIANIYIYIYTRDTTSTHYKTDTEHTTLHTVHHEHTTLSPQRRCERTFHWHSYTDDHRGQLIADVISNSDYITLNTTSQPECQTPHYNKHHHHGV